MHIYIYGSQKDFTKAATWPKASGRTFLVSKRRLRQPGRPHPGESDKCTHLYINTCSADDHHSQIWGGFVT